MYDVAQYITADFYTQFTHFFNKCDTTINVNNI